MRALLSKIRRWLHELPQQIWFLPSAITMGFFVLIALIISLRYTSFIEAIEGQLSFLALSSADTARSILSTITGGLISLMVFSFSMVMVVLNQATSQFSPRLLPGLISNRQHQFILGFYLGAILYNLSVLARIAPSDSDRAVPMIAILLAILFGVAGLVLFIVFIHAISQSVRIDSILDNLHRNTLASMEQANQLAVLNSGDASLPEEQEDWQVIESRASGYLIGIDTIGLLEYCQEQDICLSVLAHQGAFILSEEALIKISATSEASDEDKDELLSFFRIAAGEDIQSDYMRGLHQLKEIAVKAMSPGINDPATALSAIDFLTSLLQSFLKQHLNYCLVGEDNAPRIWLKPVPFSELLFRLYAPLRTYCTGDVMVAQKLIHTLRQLQKIEGLPQSERDTLENEIEEVKKDAQQRMLNARDVERILSL